MLRTSNISPFSFNIIKINPSPNIGYLLFLWVRITATYFFFGFGQWLHTFSLSKNNNYLLFLWIRITASYFFFGLGFSSILYCSWAVYCTAAYGTIRTIVAELPLHRACQPSPRYVLTRNSIALRGENFLSEAGNNTKKMNSNNWPIDSPPFCPSFHNLCIACLNTH